MLTRREQGDSPGGINLSLGVSAEEDVSDELDEEAYGADEAFLTSASQFVMPVTEIDGHRVGGGQPGPITRRLREMFLKEAAG